MQKVEKLISQLEKVENIEKKDKSALSNPVSQTIIAVAVIAGIVLAVYWDKWQEFMLVFLALSWPGYYFLGGKSWSFTIKNISKILATIFAYISNSFQDDDNDAEEKEKE